MRGNPHLCEPLAERVSGTMPGIGPCECDSEEWESCPRSGRSFRASAKPEVRPIFVNTESPCAHAARAHRRRESSCVERAQTRGPSPDRNREEWNGVPAPRRRQGARHASGCCHAYSTVQHINREVEPIPHGGGTDWRNGSCPRADLVRERILFESGSCPRAPRPGLQGHSLQLHVPTPPSPTRSAERRWRVRVSIHTP